MTMAAKLKEHLENAQIRYEVLEHPETPSASRSAEAAHVPGDRVAKAVLLRDGQGYLLAVLPSTHQVHLEALHQLTSRQLELASEAKIGEVFSDCATGAVPAIGAAYGVDVVLDETLTGIPEACFEAGDHRCLVRVSGADLEKLLATAARGRFSIHR